MATFDFSSLFSSEIVTAAITGAVQYAIATKAEKRTARAATEAAGFEQNRLNLLRTQRLMDEARESASIRRESRVNRANLLARAAILGTLKTSAVAGAEQASKTAERRELKFIGESSTLAGKAEGITSQQIEANRRNIIASARESTLAAGLEGIATVAGKFATETDILDETADLFSELGPTARSERMNP